jgi:addiction module HigA family antidote
MTMTETIAPIHPGEILLEEYLIPLGISQYRLAKETEVPPRRINEIVHGKRAITADTSLRLAKFFGTSEQFWLNLQARHDLELERDRLAGALGRIHHFDARARQSSRVATTKSRGRSRTAKSLTEAS